MKVKTAELTGRAIDWAVAVALGMHPIMRHDHMRKKAAANNYQGDLEWQLEVQPNDPITVDQGGVTHPIPWVSGYGQEALDIAEASGISVTTASGYRENRKWSAWVGDHPLKSEGEITGPTVRIAICRCFCHAKFGEETDIPEELCQKQKT